MDLAVGLFLLFLILVICCTCMGRRKPPCRKRIYYFDQTVDRIPRVNVMKKQRPMDDVKSMDDRAKDQMMTREIPPKHAHDVGGARWAGGQSSQPKTDNMGRVMHMNQNVSVSPMTMHHGLKSEPTPMHTAVPVSDAYDVGLDAGYNLNRYLNMD